MIGKLKTILSNFSSLFFLLHSHIQYFWKALELMNSDERSQFINFCSGRSRLPTSASEFPMAFKLTAPPANASKNPDNYLPIARTCFFSLSLPQYSSPEVKPGDFSKLILFSPFT